MASLDKKHADLSSEGEKVGAESSDRARVNRACNCVLFEPIASI